MMAGAAVLLALVCVAVCGCGKDPDMLSRQENSISGYFSSHGYDSIVRGGVYVHIPNAGREGRDGQPVLEWGDSLYYYYEIYPFSGFSPSAVGNPSYLIATNNPMLAYGVPGLDPSHLDLSAAGAKLGSTDMVKGLRNGLEGGVQGDSLWLFMTSDLAYGDKTVGVVEANTPLVFVINLEKVVKQE